MQHAVPIDLSTGLPASDRADTFWTSDSPFPSNHTGNAFRPTTVVPRKALGVPKSARGGSAKSKPKARPARKPQGGKKSVPGPDCVAMDTEYIDMLHTSDVPLHSAVDPRRVRQHDLQVLREAQGDAVALGAARSGGLRIHANRSPVREHKKRMGEGMTAKDLSDLPAFSPEGARYYERLVRLKEAHLEALRDAEERFNRRRGRGAESAAARVLEAQQAGMRLGMIHEKIGHTIPPGPPFPHNIDPCWAGRFEGDCDDCDDDDDDDDDDSNVGDDDDDNNVEYDDYAYEYDEDNFNSAGGDQGSRGYNDQGYERGYLRSQPRDGRTAAPASTSIDDEEVAYAVHASRVDAEIARHDAIIRAAQGRKSPAENRSPNNRYQHKGGTADSNTGRRTTNVKGSKSRSRSPPNGGGRFGTALERNLGGGYGQQIGHGTLPPTGPLGEDMEENVASSEEGNGINDGYTIREEFHGTHIRAEQRRRANAAAAAQNASMDAEGDLFDDLRDDDGYISPGEIVGSDDDGGGDVDRRRGSCSSSCSSYSYSYYTTSGRSDGGGDFSEDDEDDPFAGELSRASAVTAIYRQHGRRTSTGNDGYSPTRFIDNDAGEEEEQEGRGDGGLDLGSDDDEYERRLRAYLEKRRTQHERLRREYDREVRDVLDGTDGRAAQAGNTDNDGSNAGKTTGKTSTTTKSSTRKTPPGYRYRYRPLSAPAYRHKWKNRVTVPQPFSFLSREKKPTIAERRLREELDEKKAREIEEAEAKFRAREVPLSSLLPKYERIAAREKKRRENMARRANVIRRHKAAEERVRERKERKEKEKRERMEKAAPFTANPVPKTSTELRYDDIVASREAERIARKHERAQRLLRESKMPERMQTDAERAEEKARDAELRRQAWASERELTFAPLVNPVVPDHYRLQRQFEAQLAERREALAKQATVPKPFRLHGSCDTDKPGSGSASAGEDLAPHERRWPFADTAKPPRTDAHRENKHRQRGRDGDQGGDSRRRHRSASLDMRSAVAPPAKTTVAATLRARVAREKLAERQREDREARREERKRIAERRRAWKRLRPHLEAAGGGSDGETRGHMSAKEWKETARKQDEEMAERVAEMERRARERPYLFEQVSMESAKASAMRRFDKAMEGMGLDVTEYIDAADDNDGNGNENNNTTTGRD